MAEPAQRRRSGRRLLIAGVAVMLVAVGSLIFLTADAGDSPSPPQSTPSQTAGPTATPSSPDVEPPSPSGQPGPAPAPSVVRVPNLGGLTEAEAGVVLEAGGLQLGGRSGAEGTVVRQNPPPGTEVPAGSSVTLTLAADVASGATDQSLIGEITALIGALTGLILAVTGLIKMLRTRTPTE